MVLLAIHDSFRLRRPRSGAIYYNFILIARARGGSHYFVTLALDLMASTTSQTCKHDSAAASTSYFILTAIARVLASLNVRHPS